MMIALFPPGPADSVINSDDLAHPRQTLAHFLMACSRFLLPKLAEFQQTLSMIKVAKGMSNTVICQDEGRPALCLTARRVVVGSSVWMWKSPLNGNNDPSYPAAQSLIWC